MSVAALLLALIVAPNAEATGEPVLLDFNATWCGPCRQMRPAVEQLIGMGYRIKSIDIDQSARLAERYRVTSVPTFIVVDASGRALARTEGFQPAAQLARFYLEAKAKSSAAPPAHSNAQVATRESVAVEAGESADENEGDEDDATPEADSNSPSMSTNPKPWETVVRIRIDCGGMIGFGSGTIIHSTPSESIILTCAHIFKQEGARQQVPPSRFHRKISVDLFDGQLSGQHPRTVHHLETVEGKAIDYDFALDVGLIRIRPGRRLPASRVVPPNWQPKAGMVGMTTVGCSEGRDATAWSTVILNPRFRGLVGNSSYEAIECLHAPKQGRSGGGLYTSDGYLAGVCDFAEPKGNHGLYATPRSIYQLLDRNNLMALYTPVRRNPDRLLAENQTRPRTVTRAQSPDGEETNPVTIPDPELLGIPAPSIARTSPRRGWQAPPTARVVSQDSGESRAVTTDLSLPPEADDDRFAAITEPDAAAAPPVKPVPAPRSRTSGKWRAVKTPVAPLRQE